MRQVQVFKMESQVIEGCRQSVKALDFIGTFHQFGQEADGEGQSNPVAIVEAADGQVHSVHATMVRFTPQQAVPRRFEPLPVPTILAKAAPALLDELRAADRIINVMLNAMTLEQKSKCAAQLESEGVSPDGMTRAHERAAILAAAGAA